MQHLTDGRPLQHLHLQEKKNRKEKLESDVAMCRFEWMAYGVTPCNPCVKKHANRRRFEYLRIVRCRACMHL